MPKLRTSESRADKDVRTRAHRPWTILIYMAGDNNLSGDMASSLGAIEENASTADGSSANVNVLAYFDSASLTAPTQYIDYTYRKKPYTHNVTPYDLRPLDGYQSRDVGDPENSASTLSILSFIRWAIEQRNATADNYVLIFSGHSFGFYGSSFLADQSTGGFLTLRGFRSALEEARAIYLHPRTPDKKIAVVGFDSCEMGMLEVGYELKNVANTVVASAGNVPNAGWGYAPMLRNFVERTFMESMYPALNGVSGPKELAIDTPEIIKTAACKFVHEYVTQQQRFAVGGNSIDMAALDLDEIDPLAELVGKLGGMLSGMLGLNSLLNDGKISARNAIVHNRTKALLARSRMSCQTYMHEQSVDLKDFCQKLMFGCREILHEGESLGFKLNEFKRLQSLCRDIIKAAEKCVLQSGFSGDEYQFSKGISLYFPWTALTYLYTWDVYGNLRFACGDYKTVRLKRGKTTKTFNKKLKPGSGEAWDEFLLFYLYIVTLRQGEDVDSFDETFAALDNGGIVDGEWQQTKFNWLRSRSSRAVLNGNGRSGSGRKTQSWPKETRENWRAGTRESWPLADGRENWRAGTRENWRAGTRENWRAGTRENWRAGTRENWRAGTRENWRAGTRESSGFNPTDYMYFFTRIRNFALNWEAKGLWPKQEETEEVQKPVGRSRSRRR